MKFKVGDKVKLRKFMDREEYENDNLNGWSYQGFLEEFYKHKNKVFIIYKEVKDEFGFKYDLVYANHEFEEFSLWEFQCELASTLKDKLALLKNLK